MTEKTEKHTYELDKTFPGSQEGAAQRHGGMLLIKGFEVRVTRKGNAWNVWKRQKEAK